MMIEKKKKIDSEALNSSFMRIPKMDVRTARKLIDLGYRESYELEGLSAEGLYDEVKKKDPEVPVEYLYRLRMAIYYVERPEGELGKKDIVDFTY